MLIPTFHQITLQGEDANTFLQGQITADTTKIGLTYIPTAIANLKGRIEFGFWIRKKDDTQFNIIISSDCLASLQTHLNKFGAFSKFTISEPIGVYPCADFDKETGEAMFSHSKLREDTWGWMANSIATGNYWITAATQGLFQPQELRLHQRGGVNYDKGCYLGQEVIARVYFKAVPKAFLHRVSGSGQTPESGERLGKIKVVNAIPSDSSLSQSSYFDALVIAAPDQLSQHNLTPLDLPDYLQANVGREG